MYNTTTADRAGYARNAIEILKRFSESPQIR